MKMHYPITAVLLSFIFLMSSTATAQTGKLVSCPDSPNCVSSLAPDAEHAVAPLSFNGSPQIAWNALKAVVLKQKRTTITELNEGYLKAECRSLVFRFVDDLEFLLIPDEQLIHARSAARTGTSDFGVNRRRVEHIRREFMELLSNQAP